MSDPCLELVIYRLKKGFLEQFIHERALIVEAYQKMTGFICIETWHSLKESNLYVDILHFENPDYAAQAYDKFNQIPNKSGFMATIEKVEFSQHLTRQL